MNRVANGTDCTVTVLCDPGGAAGTQLDLHLHNCTGAYMSKRKVESDKDRVPFAFLSSYRSKEREDPKDPNKIEVLVEAADIDRSQLWCSEEDLGVDMMGLWQDYKSKKFTAETKRLNGTRDGESRACSWS